jgi:hypothetical protein
VAERDAEIHPGYDFRNARGDRPNQHHPESPKQIGLREWWVIVTPRQRFPTGRNRRVPIVSSGVPGTVNVPGSTDLAVIRPENGRVISAYVRVTLRGFYILLHSGGQRVQLRALAFAMS